MNALFAVGFLTLALFACLAVERLLAGLDWLRFRLMARWSGRVLDQDFFLSHPCDRRPVR